MFLRLPARGNGIDDKVIQTRKIGFLTVHERTKKNRGAVPGTQSLTGDDTNDYDRYDQCDADPHVLHATLY